MEMGDGDVRVVDEQTGKTALLKKALLFLCPILFTIILIAVLWVMLVGSPSGCVEENGFNLTRYTNPDGTYQEIAYIFVEEKPGTIFYNYENGKKACLELGAQMWEVLGGQSEWNVFYNIAKKKELIGPTGSGIWLNALLDQKCPGSPSKTCVEEKAQNGEGLNVKWPSTHKVASYSRLAGRDDSTGEKCIAVTDNGLWSTVECDYGFWTLCVKRNC